MTDPTLEAAAWALEATARASLVLGTGWATTRIPGGSASQRHAVWTVALLAAPAAFWIDVGHPMLATVGAVGALAAMAPLLAGWWWLRGRQQAEQPHPRAPGAWLSAGPDGPWTWGWHHRIVLPRASARWPRARLDAVLAHERAHRTRADWAWHVVAWAACSALWFHPLAWWARREHARLAEEAADAHAVATGIPPAVYARALLELGQHPAAVVGAVGVRSHLARRIDAVLTRPRPAHHLRLGAALLAVLASASAPAAWSVLQPDPTPTCHPER